MDMDTTPEQQPLRHHFHAFADNRHYIIAKIVYFICIDFLCIYLSVTGNIRYMTFLASPIFAGVVFGLIVDFAQRCIRRGFMSKESWKVIIVLIGWIVFAPPSELWLPARASIPKNLILDCSIELSVMLAAGVMGLMLAETMVNAHFFTCKPSQMKAEPGRE